MSKFAPQGKAPRNSTETFSFHASSEMKIAVDKAAERIGTNRSDFLKQAVQYALAHMAERSDEDGA